MADTLDIKMIEDNDADATTVGDYLVKLLTELWSEGEGFSGKRPFGNSGWEYELYLSLAEAGAITATFYEEGDIKDFDRKTADKLIFEAIKGLYNG